MAKPACSLRRPRALRRRGLRRHLARGREQAATQRGRGCAAATARRRPGRSRRVSHRRNEIPAHGAGARRADAPGGSESRSRLGRAERAGAVEAVVVEDPVLAHGAVVLRQRQG